MIVWRMWYGINEVSYRSSHHSWLLCTADSVALLLELGHSLLSSMRLWQGRCGVKGIISWSQMYLHVHTQVAHSGNHLESSEYRYGLVCTTVLLRVCIGVHRSGFNGISFVADGSKSTKFSIRPKRHSVVFASLNPRCRWRKTVKNVSQRTAAAAHYDDSADIA